MTPTFLVLGFLVVQAAQPAPTFGDKQKVADAGLADVVEVDSCGTGDWHIGVMTRSGMKQGDDYVCGQAPTDWGKPGFILNADSVVFFKQKDPDFVAGRLSTKFMERYQAARRAS